MKRNRYSASLKAKVALEGLRGLRTINEISTEYGVHPIPTNTGLPDQISKWKKQVLESLPELFSNGRSRGEADDSLEKDRLYQQIGQLQVVLSWLKKKTGYNL